MKLNDRSVGKTDWALLLVMSVFVFVTMFYGDLKIIYHHSLTFLDTIFDLDMPNFYANTLANPCFGFGAVYYWMAYAVIAVEQAADGIFPFADTLDDGNNLKRFWLWKRKISVCTVYVCVLTFCSIADSGNCAD